MAYVYNVSLMVVDKLRHWGESQDVVDSGGSLANSFYRRTGDRDFRNLLFTEESGKEELVYALFFLYLCIAS
jgi:hypothetical protein